MKFTKENKGITLIALIITIIILLILAGVTISQLTESGLFEKAKLANQKSENAQEKENTILKDYANKINEYIYNKEDKEYTVTFNTNGGIFTDSDGNTSAEFTKTIKFGTVYGEMPVPNKDYYSFLGWYTKEDKKILDTSILDIDSDHILYAKWEPDKYTITFDSNGGTCAETSRLVGYELPYGELPIPTRGDYIFQGWFTSKDGSEQISDNTKMEAEDITVFAQWKIVCTGEYNAHKHSDSCYQYVRVKACTGVLNAHDHTSSCAPEGCAGTPNAHNCIRAGEMSRQLKCNNLPLNMHNHLPECIY